MRIGRKLSSKNFRAPSSSSGMAAPRALANLLQRRRDRRQIAAAAALDFEGAAARQEGREGRGVIVAVPAVEIGPVDRFVLRIGKFDRLALLRCGTANSCNRDREPNEQTTADKRRQRAASSASLPGFGRDHFPVGIARGNVAREGPHVGDVGDLSALPSITAPARRAWRKPAWRRSGR